MNYPVSEWEGTGVTPENGQLSIVNNILVFGVDTPRKLTMVSPKGEAYLEGNKIIHEHNTSPKIAGRGIKRLDEKPVWPQGLKPISTKNLMKFITRNVGSRPAQRDPIDARIINDFKQRKGGVIDSQEDVGGYPTSAPTHRALTIPEDIDAWLEKHAKHVEGR
jgi:hypothetical protein